MKISLVNKSPKEIKLKIVQAPAAWASIKIPDSVKAGEKTEMEIEVDGSLKDDRNTSVTLASADGDRGSGLERTEC